MLLENEAYPADVRVRSEAESLARAGYRVTVLAPRAPGERAAEAVGAVRVVRYRVPRPGDGGPAILVEYAVANVQLHVRGLLELARGARVIHLHNPPDTLFGLGVAARWLGASVVFDHHDLAPELYTAKFGQRPRAVVWALRTCEYLSFRVASHVLAANESHRDIALSRGRLRAAAVTVVRNGPPSRTLAARGGRGGALSDPRLVFVGSMESQDGAEELADILRELARDHEICAHLTVVGDGSRRAALEEHCRRSGLAARVRFTGRVAPADVPRLLAEADICVDPAPCSELNHRSTMVKIAEYLAARRPIVAYRLRETEQTAGDAALLAECGDRAGFVERIARLAGDGELRASLAVDGRTRAEGLVWEHSERALLAAYGRL